MTSLNIRPPRVFISYAREDGEEFARDLREKLEALDIPTWLDRFGLEGGRDWWLQIQEALNKAEFLVLVMTPAAMLSANVRKEWHYARQRGVCVYPVMVVSAYEGEAFKSLPKWMRDVHFYNTQREWDKFTKDLNESCGVPRVPFMVEELPRDYVPRLSETEQVLVLLLSETREEPRAVTAGLRGAGGFGKTTLAKAICHDERVQQAFDDGILWVTLGEQPGDLTGRVEDLIYILSGNRPGFTGLDAATASLVELLAERDILMVIDDVWNAAHMRPFMQGGPRCARLITTRNDASLPNHAHRIEIEGMRRDEAVRLLTIGVSGLDEPENFSAEQRLTLRELSEQLGEWPLLLRLANGVLRERVNIHRQALPDALAYVAKALQRHGLTAFDTRQPEDRGQAVAKTLNVSLELLREIEYDRFRELVIFPEDTDIPLSTVARLWGATGGLDDFDTESLCERLYQLSLLSGF
ncbi:MAG: TIR domain-containing protein, partial [Burkholderiales bacterium]|nr:TIR domain-containing protein [Anaerolineae bacterium]